MNDRLLYLDCAGGIAGDMVLCALVEAGAEVDLIDSLPSSLGMPDVKLEWRHGRPGGFAARQLTVHFDPAAHPPHRGLDDMCSLVDRSPASDRAKAMAHRVFTTLAEAEAAVHGATPQTVHFHEVGGVDALIDILGACVAIDSLSIGEIVCSSLPMGSGTVECAHGTLPLPAPAVAAMLPGIPVRDAGVEGETVTPTGAALATSLADRFGPMPTFTVESLGIGAGSRRYPGLPNVVRAFVGSRETNGEQAEATDATIVECNVDDLDPRVLPVVINRLLEAGALDAYVTPIVMKKGRPAHLITALTTPEKSDAAVSVLLRETTTLGCRIHSVGKRHLHRRMETAETPWGQVPVKAALIGDTVIRRVAEFDACAELARTAGVPVRDILAAASADDSEGSERD